MESLGTDLVDQEISVFGMKAVTEEIGNVKAGLIGDGDLPKWVWAISLISWIS